MGAIDKDHIVLLRYHFDVPVEALFDAWSDPAQLASWAWGGLGCSARAQVDFRVGGSFRVETMRPGGETWTWAFSGRYTEIGLNRRIVQTLVWHAPMGYGPVPEQLEVEFKRDDPGSSVELVHRGVPDEKSAKAHRRGWRETLETLALHLAIPRAPGLPPRTL